MIINLLKKGAGFVAHPTSSRTTAVLTLLVILAALPLTVLISQKQQETRQRAAETCRTIASCDAEFETCRTDCLNLPNQTDIEICIYNTCVKNRNSCYANANSCSITPPPATTATPAVPPTATPAPASCSGGLLCSGACWDSQTISQVCQGRGASCLPPPSTSFVCNTTAATPTPGATATPTPTPSDLCRNQDNTSCVACTSTAVYGACGWNENTKQCKSALGIGNTCPAGTTSWYFWTADCGIPSKNACSSQSLTPSPTPPSSTNGCPVNQQSGFICAFSTDANTVPKAGIPSNLNNCSPAPNLSCATVGGTSQYCFSCALAPTPTPQPGVPTPTPTPGVVAANLAQLTEGAVQLFGLPVPGTTPRTITRTVTITVQSSLKPNIKPATGSLIFSSSDKVFKIDPTQPVVFDASVPTIPVNLIIQTDFFVGFVKGITLNPGPNSLPPTSPVLLRVGISAKDGLSEDTVSYWNALVSCFGGKTGCTVDNKRGADLNDDGKVDGIDVNIFLRSLAVIEGLDTTTKTAAGVPAPTATPTPTPTPKP